MVHCLLYVFSFFQSHQHDKSHGYLQLTDGTIEVLGNHMLGVDDKVRCMQEYIQCAQITIHYMRIKSLST